MIKQFIKLFLSYLTYLVMQHASLCCTGGASWDQDGSKHLYNEDDLKPLKIDLKPDKSYLSTFYL